MPRALTPWFTGTPTRTGAWDFERDLDEVFDALSRGFGLTPTRGEQTATSFLRPSMDVTENENAYEVTMEIPGVEENDIDLSVSENQLTVSGEKKDVREEGDGKRSHSVERMYGTFRRSIALPSDANEDKIDAKFNNGVLTITIPKAEETEAKKRKIKIKKG